MFIVRFIKLEREKIAKPNKISYQADNLYLILSTYSNFTLYSNKFWAKSIKMLNTIIILNAIKMLNVIKMLNANIISILTTIEVLPMK